jgi:hypothetical protein
MALFGNFILRFIVICFGFLMAIIAAGMFVGFGFYNEAITTGPLLESWEEDAFALISVGVGFVSTVLIGAYAYGLVAIVIAIAEMMRWKSLAANLVLGGLCAGFLLLTNYGVSIPPGAPEGPGVVPVSHGSQLVALSAGFIAGFVYWLFAGRRAGDWLGPAITDRSSGSSES